MLKGLEESLETRSATISPRTRNEGNRSYGSPVTKFWETNVSLWFATVENLFNVNGVSQEKCKYEILLGA